MRTPGWLRDERRSPRAVMGDEVARTPTSLRIAGMSREEYRVWGREKQRREQEEGNGGVGEREWWDVVLTDEVKEEEKKKEEDADGWTSPSKSWNCKMQ